MAENLQKPARRGRTAARKTSMTRAFRRRRQILHVLAWTSACALGVPTSTAVAAPAPAEGAPQAAVLFHNYCSVCHGDQGDGRSRAAGALSTPPRDFTSEASRRELTRERIVDAVTNGRPGTAMMAWTRQLASADIAALADYVLARFVNGAPTSDPQGPPTAHGTGAPISGTQAHGGRAADHASTLATVDMTAGLPNGLKGDLKRGGAFYLANCATCHGARGEGNGPRAYFINPRPRDFTADSTRARFNRVALFAAVSAGKVGTEMSAWSKVATEQQIADVSEYLFQTFVRARP
jgi:mono/diheme cytochrome c family protein